MKKLKYLLFGLLSICLALPMAESAWVITKNEINDNALIEKDANSEPVAFIKNRNDNKFYSSIERALEVATTGDIVTVIPPIKPEFNDSPTYDADGKPIKDENGKIITVNPELPDSKQYSIKRDCTIKPGVTLLVPLNQASLDSVVDAGTLNTYLNSCNKDPRTNDTIAATTLRGSLYSYGLDADRNPARYLRTTIIVEDNVTIFNKGTLLVSGYISGGSTSGGYIGQTAHSYSQILLGKNAKIIQDDPNAVTHCFGYIHEREKNNGCECRFLNGALNIPFIIDDYKGISSSAALTVEAIDKYRVAPFNQMSLRNITALMSIEYNAKVFGHSSILASYTSPDVFKMFNNVSNIIGSEPGTVFQFNDPANSSLKIKVDRSSRNFKYDFYGGCILNEIGLTLNISFATIDLNTSKGYFPFSYRFDVNLHSAPGQNEAVYDFSKQRIKLMPGSKMVVGSNVNLKANDFIIQTAYANTNTFNGPKSFLGISGSYPVKDGALFIMEEGSKASFNVLAGAVYGSASQISYTASEETIKSAWTTTDNDDKLNPPWKVDQYCDNHERLEVFTRDKVNSKKLFCCNNNYTISSTLNPTYEVHINVPAGERIEEVGKYNRVLICEDSFTSYSVTMKSDIYRLFINNNYYEKDSTINYATSRRVLTGVPSIIAISNNANGINEFNVQSIELYVATEPYNGNIPLYPGTTIALDVRINDKEKAYQKKYTFTSSDESIATVNEIGEVTGVSEGEVTIHVYMDGQQDSIVLNVIASEPIPEFKGITIFDDKGNSSNLRQDDLFPDKWNKRAFTTANNATPGHGAYKSETTVNFTANIDPSNYPFKRYWWKLQKSGVDRQQISNNQVPIEEVYDAKQVTVRINSGSGATYDPAYLWFIAQDLYNNNMVVQFEINHKADKVCLGKGTLIRMADGSLKKIEDVKVTDMVLAMNHETGHLEKTKILATAYHGKIDSPEIKLSFDNGNNLTVIGEHNLFDYTEMKYITINDRNVKDYIGHKFASFDNNGVLRLTNLESYKVTSGYHHAYTIKTYKHLNSIANSLLTETPIQGLSNYFEYSYDLSYDKIKMQKDINNYGLYTYEDWKDLIPYFMYEGYNFQYFKVSIGKELMTYEDVIAYIELAKQLLESGEMQYLY